jgi:hypothetical protein
VSFIKRKRARRQGDKFAIMRAAGIGNLPALDKPRRGKKFADPEEVLQDEVNQTLVRAGQFFFRIPASVYHKAHDRSIAGWPDNPMITRLQPGLALMGPLELKREGETLSDVQVEKQALLGTYEADTWPKAWAYIQWYWKAVEHVRRLLLAQPLPPAPAGESPSPTSPRVGTNPTLRIQIEGEPIP